ncbi:hypothetical protein EVAR_264_1 [Eumeta japonica]|uniref:Uncharacterized protein n=1 Tax=Eumeta variegata TaxID=151549 RepID=A0A4C1S973_EUMVA|nr:hypothetical protein EVAR_264_1 [Eumeta japonica]
MGVAGTEAEVGMWECVLTRWSAVAAAAAGSRRAGGAGAAGAVGAWCSSPLPSPSPLALPSENLHSFSKSTTKENAHKYQLSNQTLQFINNRRELILNGTKKENITTNTEINEKMKEGIRKDRKAKRLKTLEYHIQRTGRVKKVLEELRETG